MARRKSIEIRSVEYDPRGAIITVFVPGARPDASPTDLLGNGTGVAVSRGRPGPKGGKRSENKAAAVLAAIRGGASSAADISKKTGLPNNRVHAYIAYHKRRGNVQGSAAKGFTLA